MTLSAWLGPPAGMALGYGLDRLFGDPERWHPVAGFGRLAEALERPAYRDSRAAGVAYATALVGVTVAAGAVGERGLRGRPLTRTLVTAIATWAVLGGR